MYVRLNAYHKGLGRFLDAFPSDTGIFTTGNGPGKSNGPFDFQYRDLRFRDLTLSFRVLRSYPYIRIDQKC